MTTRVVVLLALLAVGVGMFWWLMVAQPEPTRRGPAVGRPEVRVFAAEPVEVARQWRGYGTAMASDAANVPARVTAVVEHVPEAVEAGRAVERGQLLARLDAEDFEQEVVAAEQQIEQIEAELAQLEVQSERLSERLELERQDVAAAERELTRVRELEQRDVTTQQELDRAERERLAAERALVSTREVLEQLPARRRQLEARREAQRAALAQARLGLQRTRITSPIAGVLETVDVQAGENVAAGQRIARIVSLERIEVPLRLPASARRGIALDDPVELQATDASDQRWTARVRRIAPTDDAQTRTITIYVELEQDTAAPPPEQRVDMLAPGMFVEGRVDSRRTEPRWVVPRRAIRDGAIRIIDDGRVVSRPVRIAWSFEGRIDELGLEDDRQWAVLEDELAPGQRIMVNAASTILDGQTVEPMLIEAGNSE